MVEKQRFPWVVVAAGVAVMAVAAVTWLQLPEAGAGKGAVATLPVLRLTQIDPTQSKELLAEQLTAYDPAPLFIPSPMNSNEPALPAEARSGAGGPFADIPPELTKTGPMTVQSPVPIPKTPVEGLRLTERTEAPLALARADTQVGQLKGRLGQMQAVSAAGGAVVMVLDLPQAAGFPEGDWQPLELMGAVTRAGLAGDLVVTTSSGSDEIDEFFRSHLKKNVRIGERLSEGFYALRVGP
jgi:hypothetical protein